MTNMHKNEAKVNRAGLFAPLLTADQMRRHEQEAMQSGVVSGLVLMERAGAGVVALMLKHWRDFIQQSGRVLVLCGPGNNGGDGYVIARLLRTRGWRVAVHAYGDPDRLPPDAAANAARWRTVGTIEPWQPDVMAAGPAPDLVVDALFGIGLTRPVPPEVAQALAFYETRPWNGPAPRWLAVDCPSGLNLDTGQALGPAPGGRADLTVTFHSPKPGHFLQDGPTSCGALAVADIGLEPFTAPDMELADPRGWARPAAERPAIGALARLVPKFAGTGHKYDYGHALVVGGDTGKGGAARLAARAALRVGAGLVTLVCPGAAIPENAARLDAVMLRALEAPKDLTDIVDARVKALCLGPGLGPTERTREMVLAALAQKCATVLDADALSAFAGAPDLLAQALHDRAVLTPHEGEFARVFPDLADSLRHSGDRVAAVQSAAARTGATVLLKGRVTVVAGPSGRPIVNAATFDRATPWLATAGSGDVLAGMICGLATAAPEVPLSEIAGFAAWLHVEAALHAGAGLIAEDLPEALPAVLKSLVAG